MLLCLPYMFVDLILPLPLDTYVDTTELTTSPNSFIGGREATIFLLRCVEP